MFHTLTCCSLLFANKSPSNWMETAHDYRPGLPNLCGQSSSQTCCDSCGCVAQSEPAKETEIDHTVYPARGYRRSPQSTRAHIHMVTIALPFSTESCPTNDLPSPPRLSHRPQATDPVGQRPPSICTKTFFTRRKPRSGRHDR